MTDASVKERFSFQTEVGQLLDIVAGSLYSNREIFLRELVSNSSDACDKLRYKSLTDSSLAEGSTDFAISLDVDKKAKTLSVSDNGIGMSHEPCLSSVLIPRTCSNSGTGLVAVTHNSLKALFLPRAWCWIPANKLTVRSPAAG